MKVLVNPDPAKPGVTFWCPGCNTRHFCRHAFNGDVESPTLIPSVRQEWGDGTICHSHVTAGRIQFLNDSTHHELRGWHDLPDIPKHGGGV